MSQFSLPGVQKQYKGSDFRGTAGLHSGESGSIPSGVVVFSELDRQQQAFNTAVSLLEQQYIAADASDTQAWQAATSNLSRQLNNVAQGVASRMAVAARWEGSVSSLQSGLSVSSTGVVSIPQSSGAVTIASVNADFATNEDYYTQIKATSWESLVLVHNLTTASETGLYCVSGGTLRKFSPFFSQLQDGALIFVNSGEKANTFWTIADPIVVVGTDVVIPLLIPFGAFTALQTEPNGFLSIAANQLNASLDGAYFVVSNGRLTMTPAFVARVTALETGLQTAQANISTLQTGLQSEVTTRTAADAAMQTAIDSKASATALQSEITSRSGADATLQTAIDTKASITALQAEVTARSGADATLQTAIDGNATAIQSEVTARTAADALLQTAIDSNSTAIQSEATARTAAEGLLAIDIAARTTAAQLYSAIANFTAYSHPIKALTNGAFSTIGVVPLTTFYVPLSDSLDWGVDRYSESASPFVNVQMPIVSYVNADAAGANGYFVKLEFQHDTQVPDGEVEIYLTRHYRADQTGMSFFSASTSGGSGAPTPSSLTTYWTLFRGTSYRFHNGSFERGSNGSITPIGSLNATDGFLVFSDVTGDTDLWFKDSVNGVDRYQILADVYRAQSLTSTNASTYQQNRSNPASILVGQAVLISSTLVVDGVNWTSASENGFYTVDRPGSVTGPTESSYLIQAIQSALLQQYSVYTTYDMSAVLSSQTHYFFNFTGNASGS